MRIEAFQIRQGRMSRLKCRNRLIGWLAGLVMILAMLPEGRAQVHRPTELEQIAANPAGAYNLILMSLGRQEYDRGIDIVEEVIGYWGVKAKEQFGPGFGHFYYLKGLLHMGREEYPEAMDAFRTCRDDFPNELLNAQGEAERTQLANRFRTHALAQWGACLMIVGDYAGAIEKLKEALAEAGETRIRTDIIGLNLGRSYLRNGQLEEGKELLQKALDSEVLAAEMKRKAFLILAEDWSREVGFEKVQLLLWNYGHLVREDTRANRWTRNPIFALLGRDGLARDEPLRALAWYQLLLNPQELVSHREALLSDLEARASANPNPGAEAADWQPLIAEAREGVAEAEEMVAAMLLGVGSGHYQLKNYPGAFAAFRQVGDRYPEHPRHPDALYNAVASAVQLGLWRPSRTYGERFLDRYPEHPLVAEVARLMVESIYLLEEWEESLATALEVRERFAVGSVARDVPEFVVGASLYHLDRYEEADSELGDYLRAYDEARRLEPATYYHGSTKVRRLQWKRGAEILEDFLERWPRSELVSSALYQSALCRFVLGDYENALAKLDQLHREHPGAIEIPASWNLKGDILTATGEATFEEVEVAYLEGRNLSEGIPAHFETAAYSLWKLVLLSSTEGKHAEAGAYYDEYWAKYRDSEHELEVIAAALPSLHELGRNAEAEETVRQQILRYADDAESGDLCELFGTYLGYLNGHYPPDDVLAKVRTFPAPTPTPQPLDSWLKVAEIEKLEERESLAAPGALEAAYADLEREFVFEKMPTYPVIKLARWRTEQGRDAEAVPLYESLLEARPEGAQVETAMFDLAVLLSESEDPEDWDRSIALYRSVRERVETPRLREAAIIGGGRVESKRGEYSKALSWWREYLSNRDWLSARAEANFQVGRCLEETGSPLEALKVYASVYALFPGNLDWSTQAYLRTARLLKKEGRDGDALLVVIDMLKRLGHLEHPGIEEGREVFSEWKQEWVENQ